MKEIIDLSIKVTDLLSAALQSRLLKTIKDDFAEAITNEGLLLWKKVKPLFIEEDAKIVVENFEKNPNAVDVRAEFQHILTEALRKSPEIQDELTAFLQKQPQGFLNQYINNIKNYGSGDAIVGTKVVTNNYNSGHKD